VKLGNAFVDVNNFKIFLKEFMQVHDEREKNDWAAYYRLLSDYIGVDKEGNIREKDERKCLRSVMLGYLKTYEVVQGGSCMSCNVCVPNEKFEIDLEKRKRVVVKLNEEVSEFIEQVENSWGLLPEEKGVQSFWESVQAEVAAGRSALGYVEGATGRMLDDNPAHIPALYLRLTGMAASIMAMDQQAFCDNAETLVANCSVEDAKRLLGSFLPEAKKLFTDQSALLKAEALALRKVGAYSDEFELRESAYNSGQLSGELFDSNSIALCELTDHDGHVTNAEKFKSIALDLARRTQSRDISQEFYQILLQSWNWERVKEELDWQGWKKKYSDTRMFILEQWVEHSGGFAQAGAVYGYLEDEQFIKGWPAIWDSRVLKEMPIQFLDEYPKLKRNYWQAVELYNLQPVAALYARIFADFLHEKGVGISQHNSRVMADVLFKRFEEKELALFLEKNRERDGLFSRKLFRHLKLDVLPDGFKSLSGWISLFHRYINTNSHDLTRRMTERLFLCTKFELLKIIEEYSGLLEVMTISLLGNEQHAGDTHALWMKYCEKISGTELLLFYCKCLVGSGNAQAVQLDEVVNELIDRGDGVTDQLVTALADLVPEGVQLPECIFTCLLDFKELVYRLKEDSDIDAFEKLTPRHFQKVFSIFQPAENMQRADMVVALLTALRKYLVQSWLTPVSYLAEAYGFAYRVEELEDLVSRYEDLSIGRNKIPAVSFVEELTEENSITREKSKMTFFLDQIAEYEVAQWRVAKRKVR
jgi:hypothetical protein